MTKITKDEQAALTGIQNKPYGMIKESIATKLIAAGLATYASVQLSEADATANIGNVPLQVTLVGNSFGLPVDAGETDAPAA